MLPAAALSAFLCALVVWPWASPTAVTAVDFGWLVLFGTTQFGLGQLLLTLGLRSVSATRSALTGALETPLAPAILLALPALALTAVALRGYYTGVAATRPTA